MHRRNYLGARCSGSPRVAAWIEVESDNDSARSSRCVSYEDYVERSRVEKADKLKTFQDEVRQRVKQMRIEKDKLIQQKNSIELDLEARVLGQSALAADNRRLEKRSGDLGDGLLRDDDLVIHKVDTKTGSTKGIIAELQHNNSALRRLLASQKFSIQDNEEVPSFPAKSSMVTAVEQSPFVTLSPKKVKRSVYTAPQRHIRSCSPPKLERNKLAYLYPDIELDTTRFNKEKRKLYRKVFSEEERKQAREAARHKEARARVASLKEEREQQRQVSEWQMKQSQLAAQLMPVTVVKETEKEEYKKKEQQDRRYIAAVRQLISELATTQRVSVPNLCMCGAWDESDPWQCANNCTYYRDPRALIRSLELLLHQLKLKEIGRD